eukprot:2982984-Heterocapsa_arctica.AAC.1
MHDLWVTSEVENTDVNEQLLLGLYVEVTKCLKEVTPMEPCPAARQDGFAGRNCARHGHHRRPWEWL